MENNPVVARGARPSSSRRAFGASHTGIGRRSSLQLTAAVGIVASLAVIFGLVAIEQHSVKYALGAAILVLALGVFSTDPTALAAVAIPATVLVARLAGASTNLSFSDAILFVATIACLFVVKVSEDKSLRTLLWLVAAYQALTFVAVVDHPYRADWIEWVHEAFLSGGALIIGWVVGRTGRARPVLIALIIAACALALAACGFSLAHHLHPAFLPYGYQKNFIGDWLAFPALVAFANPEFVGLSGRARAASLVILVAGIAASGSRQAVIGLAIAVIVVARRGRGLGRYKHWIQALVVLGIGAAAYETQRELVSSNTFNSAHQRITWYKESLQLFHLSPLLGEGFRWWYTSRFPFAFAPPNAELELMTSVGLIGLFAYFLLHVGALRVLWQLPAGFGTLAFAGLLMRLVQGQVDEFWLTSQSSLPWMIAGVCMGALVFESTIAPKPIPPPRPDLVTRPRFVPRGGSA